MKRIMSIVLSLVMLLSVASGCSPSAPASSAAPAPSVAPASSAAPTPSVEQTPSAAQTPDVSGPPKFKVGVRMPATTDPALLRLQENVMLAVKAAGGELLIENAPLTPEGIVGACERLIAAGVDGLLVIPPSDAVLPRIMQMCEEAKIPWATYFREINDPEVKKLVEASPYYLGRSYDEEERVGYNVAKALGELGSRNLALVALPKGDTTGDLREKGMRRAADEMGMKIIAEVRNPTQSSDAAKAIESVLTTYPETDGILLAASAITPGIIPAIIKTLETYGKDKTVKVGTINLGQGLGDLFEKGQLHVVSDGVLVWDPLYATAILLNHLMGTPLSTDGTPVKFVMDFTNLSSKTDIDNYIKYCERDYPVYTTEEYQQKFLKAFNPSVTKESIQEEISKVSLADVIERHKDLVK